MSELKLLPCPFCGGSVTAYADRYEKVMIECGNCKMYFGVQLEIGCELKDGWKATLNSKEDAIKHWNTRNPMANIVEKLEEEKQRLKGLKNDCIALSDSEVIAIEEKAYNFAINIVKQEINNGLE